MTSRWHSVARMIAFICCTHPLASSGQVPAPAADSSADAQKLREQQALDAAKTQHLFTFDTSKLHTQPNTVAVAGSFNGWSKSAHPMQRAADGTWSARVPLDDGIHHYKFVLDNEEWVYDPRSDQGLEEPDGHGGNNSAVLIGEDPRMWSPAKPNDINSQAVRHQPDQLTHQSVVSDELLLLAVETQQDDVQRVEAWTTRDDNNWQQTDLTKEAGKLGRETYLGVVQSRDNDDTPGGTLRYVLAMHDGNATVYLSSNGITTRIDDAKQSAYTVEMTPSFATPDWAKRAVWYQIFAERFRNGDPSNDPGAFAYENLIPWTSDWWQAHTRSGEEPGINNFYKGAGNVWDRRYGGDLQGAREALPYLRKLGINALYFNPVFEGESMHKYDTADFRHIDDNFGIRDPQAPKRYPPAVEGETHDPATWGWSDSDKLFLAFIQDAKSQGFKVVIDGVFNHVGRAHPFFIDVLTHGKNSTFAEWFEITDWGDPSNWRAMDKPFEVHGKPGGIQWKAWDSDNGWLPVFRKDAELGLVTGPREHIFAITQRWMDPNNDGDPSDGIDGWRLDVPGDIPHPFWRDWRKVVKTANPDAYITGEIWGWAQAWLGGDQFDAVMNYQFAMAGQDFFVDQETAITPTQFGQRLNRVVYSYPMQVALAQQNLYDSHDTDRLASMFVNPDRPYDGQNRIQDNGPDYDPREPNAVERKRMMQAVAFQMTFLGAPMIYYGTEAGMWSPDDPSNRMPMVWEDLGSYEGKGVRFMPEVFDAYRRLIALRNAVEPLQLGSYETVLADDEAGIFAFARHLGDDHAIVVMNRSAKERRIKVPVDAARYVDLMNPRNATVTEADSPLTRDTLQLTESPATLNADDDTVRLTMPAWSTAVLIPH